MRPIRLFGVNPISCNLAPAVPDAQPFSMQIMREPDRLHLVFVGQSIVALGYDANAARNLA